MAGWNANSEAAYKQFREGMLDEDTINTYRVRCRNGIAWYPTGAELWEELKHGYSADFRAWIDAALDELEIDR